MALVPKRFGFIRTTLALWGADLFGNRAGVVTDAPKDAGTLETWGWYDGSTWRYAARRGGDETFGNISVTGLTSTGGATITGDLVAQKTTAGETNILIAALAGSFATIRFTTSGSDRWLFRKTSSAESGSNAGSDLELIAMTDAGVIIDRPIQVARVAGGPITFVRKINASSGVGFYGQAAPTTRPTVNAACTDLATAVALVNQLRTHLIACGMVQ
jgi:hypothetical protein